MTKYDIALVSTPVMETNVSRRNHYLKGALNPMVAKQDVLI